MHVRVCRDCGEEYRPEIVVCADCGGRLEDRLLGDEAWPPPPPPPPAAPLDLSRHRALITNQHASPLVPFAERLEQAGIAVTIHRVQHAKHFTLYVPVVDEERALREISPLLEDGRDRTLRQAAERDFDPETGYRRCPACGSDLRGSPEECPECGLALASEPGA